MTVVHSSDSGPAVTLSPCAQETLASPTRSVARPSCTPPNAKVVPRMSASAPLPVSVTEQELVEHETLSEPTEQADSGASASPPAWSPAA